MATSAVTSVTPSNLSNVFAVAAGSGASGDACFNLSSAPTSGSAVSNELLNFVRYQTTFAAAYDAQKSSSSNYLAVVTSADAQAALETAWLQAYYYSRYW